MDYIKAIADKLTNNLDEFHLSTCGIEIVHTKTGMTIFKNGRNWDYDSIKYNMYVGNAQIEDPTGDFEKIFDSVYSILEARQKEARLKKAVDRLYRDTRPWYKKIFSGQME